MKKKVCKLAFDLDFTSAPREISTSIHLIAPETAVTCNGVSPCIKINNDVSVIMESSKMQTPHWILKNTGLYYIFIYTYVQCYGEILNSQFFSLPRREFLKLNRCTFLQ